MSPRILTSPHLARDFIGEAAFGLPLFLRTGRQTERVRALSALGGRAARGYSFHGRTKRAKSVAGREWKGSIGR
jgi:hypothetical protein